MFNASEIYHRLFLKRELSLVKSIMRDISCCESTASIIAQQSYKHDNGFTKLVIAMDENIKIRLHFWEERRINSFIESNIHSHRWNFQSLVIGGILEDIEYSIQEGLSHWQYEYRHDKDLEYACEELGKCAIIKKNSKLLKANMLYRKTYKELHAITPVGVDCAVTIVAHTTKPESNLTLVVSKQALQSRNLISQLTTSEVMRISSKVLDHVR